MESRAILHYGWSGACKGISKTENHLKTIHFRAIATFVHTGKFIIKIFQHVCGKFSFCITILLNGAQNSGIKCF